jgi:hypothetical protein
MSDVAGWLGARATSAVRSLDFPANVWCHAAKPGVLGAGAATDCAKGVAEEILRSLPTYLWRGTILP